MPDHRFPGRIASNVGWKQRDFRGNLIAVFTGAMSVLPNPMHPAVVHFPIVMMFLVPIFAGAALFAIRRGALPFRAWLFPVLAVAALAVSAWVSVRTGGAQEDRVERVVSEQAFEAHEESAETFLVLSVALLALMAAGLLRGRIGGSSRVLATLGAVALVGVGARVGHTGGMLVYREGAAAAYTGSGTARQTGATVGATQEARGGEAPRGNASTDRARDGDDDR